MYQYEESPMMAEDAVRTYLTYLQDPSSFRDLDEVNRLTG